MNASTVDLKNDNNGSHDSMNSQPNFTEVSINLRSAEPTGDSENGCATSGGQYGAPGRLNAEALTVPVDDEEKANSLIDQIPNLQKTPDHLTSRMDSAWKFLLYLSCGDVFEIGAFNSEFQHIR